MKKLILIALMMCACSDDDGGFKTETVTVDMTCSEAWSSGNFPDEYCLSDTSAWLSCDERDTADGKCIVKLCEFQCEYCEGWLYSCSIDEELIP